MGASRKQSHCRFICDFNHPISFFFLAKLPAPRKAGSLLSPLFHSALPASQVFIITFFLLGFWVRWHEPHTSSTGKRGCWTTCKDVSPSSFVSWHAICSWAVIYHLSISKSPQELSNHPHSHFDSSCLELAETEVSSWEDSVLFQEALDFVNLG